MGPTGSAALARPGTRAPGRVVRVDRGLVTVVTTAGTERATRGPGAEPVAVGDWVLVAGEGDRGGRSSRCVARRSAFVRGDPMEGVARRARRCVAANVDVVLVVQSLARTGRTSGASSASSCWSTTGARRRSSC
ncbi:MAG: hypothetical protein KatS3mg009_2954 [Acidimicrobiia bacterium]|nr:MAG: hypothetical protein KatS3mg009_2954 [Acidimicrobiia bacterium]